jgi:hypothetical protein
MLDSVKSTLLLRLPRLYYELSRLRFVIGHKVLGINQSPTARYVAAYGWRTQYGPFAGTYHRPGGASNFPQLLGSYEREVYPALERLLQRTPDLVVNIGAAGGYYAVGVAKRLPHTPVIAYEMSEALQRLCALNAAANGVGDRLTIRGECDVDELRQILTGRSLILCDCEGCEMTLLDQERVPVLRTCDVLVEVHDFVDPAISKTLIERFAPTHEIEVIDSVEKSPEEYPALRVLASREAQIRALGEHRPGPMQWLVMTARTRPDA